jgi:hypothetical protein
LTAPARRHRRRRAQNASLSGLDRWVEAASFAGLAQR